MSTEIQPAAAKKIREVFVAHPGIESAILYGSRALKTHREGSDIDLTLTGSSLDLTELSRIETELDDLLLPQKIDLSLWHQIENDSLLAHIKRVGKEFYTNSSLASNSNG